jgi:eukaryotic-like serine/threonine-protein kinase
MVKKWPADQWARIDAIFEAALQQELHTREAFVRNACGAEQELCDEVMALLRSEAAAEQRIGESATAYAVPLIDAIADADHADQARVGRRFGAWSIVREIGRGGMGRVYLAERADEEYRQQVALKIVKRGMDTDEVLRRFRFERQVLASLQHPNISRLLDGGATDDGLPFIVMEYVPGETITHYCDVNHLDVNARLRLFRVVCDAVQYAHRNMVIHCDLKPSNILVDAQGVVKLLDFGIAKLLAEGQTDQTPQTRPGLRVLTPGYASPEQLAGERMTTASDEYSLGVLLHELLTGKRPTISNGRPEPMPRELRGDLETIVAKTLAPQPLARYGSIDALAEDLDRHLEGLPLRARPATWRDRTVKFVWRNRVGVAAAALVAVSLFAGTGVAMAQAERATRQREVAELERENAERATHFLEELLSAADPEGGGAARRDTLRVGALLTLGAAQADEQLADRPVLQARMQRVIGRAQRSLGALDAAQVSLGHALATQRRELPAGDVNIAETLTDIGTLRLAQGVPARAEESYREALQIRRVALPPDHVDVARALANVGAALIAQARLDSAAVFLDEALAIHRRRAVPDSAALATALSGRMALADRTNDLPTALALSKEVLEIDRARLGDAHPRVARAMNNRAFLLSRSGEYVEAERVFRETLAIVQTSFGAEHPNFAATLDNLALAVSRQGRLSEADSLYQQAIGITRRTLGPRHPQLSVGLGNFADLLVRQGNFVEAERLYREGLGITREAFPATHPSNGILQGKLGSVLCRQGRRKDGARELDAAIVVMKTSLPPGHPRIADAVKQQAECVAGK